MSQAGAIRAGRAFVEAYLDKSRLEADLGKLQDRFRTFSRQIGAIGGTITAMGASAIGPMAALVTQFAAMGDQLDKMSARTGASVEFLSEMGFAAEQTGGNLDALGSALFRMRRRVANAATESGPAVRAIDALGMSAEKLAKLSPEDQFLEIAKRMKGIKDESLAAQYAFEIFGDGAKSLLPLLAEGEDGIEALRQRARELGITLDTESAKQAAEFTDAVNELRHSLIPLGTEIARHLIPAAIEWVETLRNALPQAREWLGENGELILTVAKVAAGLMAAGTAMLGLSAASAVTAHGIGTVRTAVQLLTGNLTTLGKVAPAAFAVAGIVALAYQIYQANEDVQALNRSMEKSIELDKQLADRRSRQHQETLEQGQGLSGADRDAFFAREIEEAEKNLAGMQSQLEAQRKTVQELQPTWRGLWQAGRAQWAVEKQELRTINDQYKEQKKRIFELKKARQAQADVESTIAARSEEELRGIGNILERLNEDLETFGMDAGEKALRSLEKLNANEEELAEARGKLADLAAKQAAEEARQAEEQALQRAEDEAARAAEAIERMLQNLADEVDDLKVEDTDERARQALRRDLERMGAAEDKIAEAMRLLDEKLDLTRVETDPEASPSAAGGTFSSLAGLMFSGHSITEGEKQIITAVKQSGQKIADAIDDGGLG